MTSFLKCLRVMAFPSWNNFASLVHNCRSVPNTIHFELFSSRRGVFAGILSGPARKAGVLVAL